MTISEALDLQVGDVVASPLSLPSWQCHRVTDVWVSGDRSSVRMRLGAAGDWIDPRGYVRAPSGTAYRKGMILRSEHWRPVNTDVDSYT